MPVCALTLQLQSGTRLLHLGLLHLGLLLQEGLRSPRSIPPQTDIWPPDGSLGEGTEGPFWVFQGEERSPDLVSAGVRARRLHANARLSHTHTFPTSLPSPSQPRPGFGEEQD